MKRWMRGAAAICWGLVALGGKAVLAEDVWLSSLDLANAKQGWGQPQADKSVGGAPLTLNGKVYAHGFGTHAPGILVIDLDGGAGRFMATVGIDDETAGKGRAEFEVLGTQHQILWRSGVRRPGMAPVQADVDLTGQQQIVLRVATGGAGNDWSHADWADARFEVSGAHPHTIPYSPGAAQATISLAPVPDAPQIHPPRVAAARPGEPFLWTVPVSGARPLIFSAQGLPPGLHLDKATGAISGRLGHAGDFAVHVQAVNRAGRASGLVHIIGGNTQALTPPMGWNSYDSFGDQVTEAQTLANARYVAEKMQPFGWQYVVVDYRWYDPNAPQNPDAGAPGETLSMDQYGRLTPAVNRFPSAANGEGFKRLADQVHAMGLRFGIHIMRGIPRRAVQWDLPILGSAFRASEAADTSDTCTWCPDMYGVRGNTPGGQAYYDSLFRLYASWGVDFVKMDDTSRPYHTDEIEAVRKAIDKCGRAIVYSLSPGATPLAQGAHVAAHANMWREADDFWDSWIALDNEFALGDQWRPYAGPGHWPDGDMLPLGHISLGGRPVGADRRTNFTHAEQMTLVSLWSLLPSPLIVGADLPDNDPWTLALLTNPEVLALDQDSKGAAAKRIASQDETEVWTKPLADGSVAVGLFNRGDFDTPVTVRRSVLGIPSRCTVRNLWLHQDLGGFGDAFTATVPSHGVVLVRVMREK